MTQEPEKFLGHPAVVKELKLKLAEGLKETARLAAVIAELERLPVVHGDLQAKNQALSRAIFYLESEIEARRKQAAQERGSEILKQDLTDLAARTQHPDKREGKP